MHGLCTIFKPNLKKGVSIMKLKMDKSSYKSAENYLGKGEEATVILAGTTSAKTMGRCVAKSTDTVTGQIYLTFGWR